MVGDRLETDGLFARRLGCRFALVRTGVVAPDSTPPSDSEVRVDLDVADLAAVARRLVHAERIQQ
jgi:ribonucleotide monophosphatase NagD (HAD superfamily)